MRKQQRRAAKAVGLAVFLGIASSAAYAGTPVSFTGTSGGYWSLGTNWSTGIAPITSGYDVTLSAKYVHFDVLGSTSIGSLAMDSLSAVNLSANCNLTVLNDAAWNHSSVLAAANFSAPNTTNVDACSFDASIAGATISLPAVAAYYSGTNNPQWQAFGAGARLSAPALTTMTFGNSFYFIAGSGGDIEAPSLNSLAFPGGGTLVLQSAGASSMVNVSGLPQTLTSLRVTAGTGGTVNWGSPTTVTGSQLIMDGNATLNTASLTNIDSTHLTASGGANFALPAVASYTTLNTQFVATGANSKLSLPALTGVTFINAPGYNSYLWLTASAGGDVEVPNLATYTIPTNGGPVISSTGTNSLVNVSSLPTSLTAISVTFGGGGSVNWGSPTAVTASQLTQNGAGGTLNTAALANIDNTNLTSLGGASFTLPAVTSYATLNTTWTANGAGSKLTLPSLTSVTLTNSSPYNSYLWLTAVNGGDIELPSLASYTIPTSGGPVIESTGANSMVNVSGLPKTLTALKVTVGTGGTVNWGSPTTVTNSQLVMNTSGTLNTAALTNIDNTNLTASGGATFTLPAVASYAAIITTWTATGANSKLSLPALANVTMANAPSSSYLYLTASLGGDVEVPSLASYTIPTYGGLVVSSTDANSLVNISGLNKTLTAISVNVRGGGAVNWGSPTAVTNSQLIMDASGTLNTAALTNIDNTNLTASGGATFTFAAVATYTTLNTNFTASGSVAGASSKLSLPALANEIFTNSPGYNSYLWLTAQTGGEIDLPNLSSFTVPTSGGLIVSSTGANSLVNLPSLLSTAAYPGASISLGGGGAVILGAPGGDLTVSFNARFTNLTGLLEILENDQVVQTITPSNLNAWQPYQFSLPPASSLEFLTTGTSSAVTLAAYQVVPEPAGLSLLAIGAASLLRRRRRH